MGIRGGGAPAYAHIRRAFERGEPLSEWARGALLEDNERCLDALAPLLMSDGPVWLPGVEGGEARRMLGRAMVEQCANPGPSPRNISEAEFNEEGVAFAPFVTDEQCAAFLAALTREAEKRVLVMPMGADLDRYASEVAPSRAKGATQ